MNASLVLIVIMAVMYACGIFMLLERSMTRVLIGFLLLGNATNILILIMAGTVGIAPFVAEGVPAEELHDPLPQALSLTAIVITFGLSAFLLALIYRSWHLGHVDEVEDDPEDIAVGERDVAVEDEESDPQFAADTDFESEVATAPHADQNDRRTGMSGGSE
jgi:multisubunit Na+/H+ antiporter MnhC subunit